MAAVVPKARQHPSTEWVVVYKPQLQCLLRMEKAVSFESTAPGRLKAHQWIAPHPELNDAQRLEWMGC